MIVLATVKAHLGVTSTDDDVVLQDLLNSAIQRVGEACNRELVKEEREVTFDGDGSGTISLPHPPVVMGDAGSVEINGELIDAKEFALDSGAGILRRNGVFPEGFQNVKVKYTGGFETFPAEIKDAILEVVAIGYAKRKGNLTDENCVQRVKSVRNGDQSVQYENVNAAGVVATKTCLEKAVEHYQIIPV